MLMTESESVEDMNIRLKTEIQRLKSEKMNLEKLLGDPKHRASCRHSPRCSKTLRPPLVIVTPADSPDTTSSSCSSSPTSSTSSSSLGSPTSPPLTSPISYKAPPQAAPQTPPSTQVTSPMTSPNATSCASASSSQFLAPKYSPPQNLNQRHNLYQYPGRSQQNLPSMGEKQHYGSPPSPTGPHAKPAYNYSCLGVPRSHEFIPPNPPSQKSVYTTPKSRNAGLVRYSPYSGRPPPVPSPLATHTHPQPGALPAGDTYLQSNNNSGCGREDQQAYVTDAHTNQFFPPCSYSSM